MEVGFSTQLQDANIHLNVAMLRVNDFHILNTEYQLFSHLFQNYSGKSNKIILLKTLKKALSLHIVHFTGNI